MGGIKSPAVDDARVSFEEMAPFYDRFTSHHDYEGWFSHLLPPIEARGLAKRGRLLDIGCGTGKSFLPMLSRGWEVTACDLSESMVREAGSKDGDEVRLEVADMRDLPCFGEFDLVWTLDDAVNYLDDADELEATFRGMAANLAPGGLIAFDTNTLKTYRTFYVDTQESESEGLQLRWRGLSARDVPPGSHFEARFEVTGEDGELSSAVHRQRHFPVECVRDALAAAGLECLDVFGIGFDAVMRVPLVEEEHTKAIFIARAARPDVPTTQ
jgi:SAM-dependent methyltransferase